MEIAVSAYKIAWLPGDGVGNDVMEAARLVLDALALDAEYIHGDIGWDFWCNEGDALPARTVEMLQQTNAALFGAITSKPASEATDELAPELRDKGFNYFSPIVRLRQQFNLHTNLRPCKAYPGNPLNFKEGIDLVVFRENTEGLYSGIEAHPVPEDLFEMVCKHSPKAKRFADTPRDEMAMTTRLVTRAGCESIVRQAFSYAKANGRRSVTLVEKPNVLRQTGGLFTRVARAVAKEYPDIPLWETNIDAMCMWLVKNPDTYDVLVAGNMFGDIISDLAAQLVGGLGFASSGNIGDKYAVFEPTHGSAPKYAGQYKVNPTAMLLSAKMMLDYLGEGAMGEKLEAAVAKVLAESKVRTYDMGGSATTLEMAEEVARKL